ncbi:MAG TPA: cation diffusion facilitator family transporter [Actinomycetaceae bacterium]|nr:cation diffusion facilitator family transporter [Actinomycetaceae bacterium]
MSNKNSEPPAVTPPAGRRGGAEPVGLTKYAWLSIAAAITTIGLKSAAWALTGSVGLLSDAAESLVNLAAAIVALIALKVAASPPTERFLYGRSKAEYFSAAIEGVLIFVAAGAILIMAAQRFVNPQPLENVDAGLIVSVIASVVNGGVGLVLWRAGVKHRSLTLRADAKHLWTDVLTSIGVIVGVLLVWATGINQLDALVAFAVGINIVVTGVKLMTESMRGLMDETLTDEENEKIIAILNSHSEDGETAFHGLQTRASGRERFMNVHVLVPGVWTVAEGHDFIDAIEEELHEALPGVHMVTHLEPIEDPLSYEDIPVGHLPITPRQDGTEDD